MTKSLPQRLDDLARGSRLYGLTMIERPAPRNLRWQPGVIIASMLVGYILLVASLGVPQRSVAGAIAGSLLLFGGFLAANYVRFLGPRLMPYQAQPLDEREIAVKARAGSMSGTILIVLAIGGCFYMGAADAFALWAPRRPLDWIYLGLMIEGWWFTLPVLVASWLQPAAGDDDA